MFAKKYLQYRQSGVRRDAAGRPTQAVLHRGLQGEGEQLLQPGDDQVRLDAPADGNLSAEEAGREEEEFSPI